MFPFARSGKTSNGRKFKQARGSGATPGKSDMVRDEELAGSSGPGAVMPRTIRVLSVPLLAICCSAAAAATKPVPIDADFLAARRISIAGTLVMARHLTDRDGDHVLVLSRKAGPSPSAPASGRIEHVALLAALHSRGTSGAWRQTWTIRDVNDCPGLDGSADFFVQEVSFTDIDRDGRTEVTVPYRMFCGGGIEPDTVKVILRQGTLKLAIRGEAQVRLPGQAFGGEHRHDKALLDPRNAAFKRHLDAVWKNASIDDRR